MEEVKKMFEEKREKLINEVEEIRALVSKKQKEMAEKEKEVMEIEEIMKKLGVTENPEKEQDQEERAKSYYVIYNGPGKGVYSDWRKASLFITGISGIIHKKFLSKKEAEDSLAAEQPQQEKAKKTFVQKVTEPAPARSTMIKLGKIPSPKTIDSIRRKEELQQQKRLTKKIFDEEYNFLLNYTEEDKVTSIYPADTRVIGPKAIVLPEADPIKIYMLFQAGLIDTIYFRNMEPFRYFPENMKKAIQVYSKRILDNREGFFKIFATIPEFKDEEVIQPAIQLCQVGVSHSNYPVLGESDQTNELEAFLQNYLLILTKGIRIKGRINYTAKSTIIWSQQLKDPAKQDVDLLSEFLQRCIKIEFSFSTEVKKEICQMLKREFAEDHICQICEQISEDLSPVKDE